MRVIIPLSGKIDPHGIEPEVWIGFAGLVFVVRRSLAHQ